LQFKKVGRFWSARVGLRYRAVAVEADGDLVWFWIGFGAPLPHVWEQGNAGAPRALREQGRRSFGLLCPPAV
jgi:hypothetical protein